jgi:phycobilisome core-membrane linker protein
VAAGFSASISQYSSQSSSRPAGGWRAAVSGGNFNAFAKPAGAAMVQALKSPQPQGFRRRQSLARPLSLPRSASAQQFQAVIDACYRQLLNRVPLAVERLGDSESQFRNRRLSVAAFVALVAGSDAFQQRLNKMAPLRAASAAYLCLLGRAAQPAEVSRFLAIRTTVGLVPALEELLSSDEYARNFGQDTVPYVLGMATQDGIPLSTVNRTAALYNGNAGLNPSTKGAV